MANVETKRLNIKEVDPDGTCTGSIFYSVDELKEIEALEPARRQFAEALAAAAPQWRRDAYNAGVQAVRWGIDQQEYNAKAAVLANAKPKKNGEPEAKVRVTVEIQGLLELVQVPLDPDPVQAPENGMYNTFAPAVSFMPVDSSLDVKLASEPTPPTPREIPEQEMFEHLAEIAKEHRLSLQVPNSRTLKNFWEVAMRYAPNAQVADIGHLIVRILRENPGLKTWGGVYKEFCKEAEEGAKARGASS